MAEDEKAPSGWLPPRPPEHGPGSRGFAAPVVPPWDRGATPSEQSGPRSAVESGVASPPGSRPVFVRAPKASERPSGLARTSLVLGVAGLVVLLVSLGLAALISLVCSGAAWALALVDRRRARTLDPDRPPPATAGLVLGVLGVVLAIVALVLWSMLLASGGSAEEILEQWRQELERRRQDAQAEI